MLRPIPPARLRDEWGWVRNGLLHAIEKTGEEFIPEDVYHAIRAGTSHLFALQWGADDIGFCVLEQHNDVDGVSLFVWILWCEPGIALPLKAQIQSAIDEKARSIGAVRVRMHSPRKGWAKWGYTPRATVYERGVL